MVELKSTVDVAKSMLSRPVIKEVQDYTSSAGQQKYYTDLCAQKGVEIDTDVLASGVSISMAIKELLTKKTVGVALKMPSDKQIARIKEQCEIMGMKEPDYTKLDGSYNGSASQLIQKLSELVKDKPVPLTEKQYETLIKYTLCPAVQGIDVTEVEKMTKQEASELIGKFQGEYAVWIKSRLSTEQFNKIEKLMNLMDSEIRYESIIQLDTEAASKYIDQLQFEYTAYAKGEWQKTTLEAEEMRGIKTKDEEKDPDGFMQIRGLMARLYAAIGQELDEETMENLDLDKIKDLVDLVRLYGIDVEGFFDEITVIPEEQVTFLLN